MWTAELSWALCPGEEKGEKHPCRRMSNSAGILVREGVRFAFFVVAAEGEGESLSPFGEEGGSRKKREESVGMGEPCSASLTHLTVLPSLVLRGPLLSLVA